MSWQICGRLESASAAWVYEWERPAVMGVLNVTPDSFSDGGRFLDVDAAVRYGAELAAQGAAVIDVGGESTRPGAAPVPEDEEIGRVLPVIERLVAEVTGDFGPGQHHAGDGTVLVSIDTRHPAVAEAAIGAGARLVNDVSGLRSPEMIDVCASAGVPAVVMHMLGEPATMQEDPRYDDVVAEVGVWLAERAEVALDHGVPSVIVDPGIGFGKLRRHNLELLDAIDALGPWPVLVGASRKGFIGELSGVDEPTRRDAGSVAAHLHAVARGAAVVRAHDVAGHVQALAVADAWPLTR